jgi:hypothetical protein
MEATGLEPRNLSINLIAQATSRIQIKTTLIHGNLDIGTPLNRVLNSMAEGA